PARPIKAACDERHRRLDRQIGREGAIAEAEHGAEGDADQRAPSVAAETVANFVAREHFDGLFPQAFQQCDALPPRKPLAFTRIGPRTSTWNSSAIHAAPPPIASRPQLDPHQMAPASDVRATPPDGRLMAGPAVLWAAHGRPAALGPADT